MVCGSLLSYIIAIYYLALYYKVIVVGFFTCSEVFVCVRYYDNKATYEYKKKLPEDIIASKSSSKVQIYSVCLYVLLCVCVCVLVQVQCL